jgi:hypothetical protein
MRCFSVVGHQSNYPLLKSIDSEKIRSVTFIKMSSLDQRKIGHRVSLGLKAPMKSRTRPVYVLGNLEVPYGKLSNEIFTCERRTLLELCSWKAMKPIFNQLNHKIKHFARVRCSTGEKNIKISSSKRFPYIRYYYSLFKNSIFITTSNRKFFHHGLATQLERYLMHRL